MENYGGETMKLLIRSGKVYGTATDDYAEGEWQPAPVDFNIDRISDYVVEDGVLKLITPIPTITRAQAKAALIINGLIGQVQPAIDAISDPLQKALAQNDWDERLTFERNNPTLVGMAAALGMTDAQLDALFVQASTL